MDITYLGQGSIRLSGKNVTIVSDPAGLPKGSLDVVLLTDTDLVAPQLDKGMVIDSPGEYEVGGSMIVGLPAQRHIDEAGNKGTIYVAEVDDVRVGIIGNVTPKLRDTQVETLGQIDILVIPVGNHGLTLDSTAAVGIISQIEPKYVIPVHYDDGKSKYAMPQDKVEVFLKEIGSHAEPVARLKVDSRSLPEETTVVVLES